MDWTTILVAVIGSGIINTIIVEVIAAKKQKFNKHAGYEKAARLIVKDRLRELLVKYIDQGWIYEDELEDIIAMHECYHDDLKGNGFLDELMRRVKLLEIRGVGVK